jgi:hypothetical protein
MVFQILFSGLSNASDVLKSVQRDDTKWLMKYPFLVSNDCMFPNNVPSDILKIYEQFPNYGSHGFKSIIFMKDQADVWEQPVVCNMMEMILILNGACSVFTNSRHVLAKEGDVIIADQHFHIASRCRDNLTLITESWIPVAVETVVETSNDKTCEDESSDLSEWALITD